MGRGFRSKESLISEKVEYFSDKNIIQINGGIDNCLALSSKGQIYGWGRNNCGQVGCGKNLDENEYVLIPKIIEISIPIKFIYCSDLYSFVVGIDGSVYYWGMNSKNQIQWNPKKLILKNVMKIKSVERSEGDIYPDHYIILKESGKVFMYNLVENKIIFEIIVGLKVNDIIYYLFETEECVYEFDCLKKK